MCTCVCKCENETTPVIRVEGIKGEHGGVNSSMTYLIYYKNLCECHSVPPTQHNNRGNKMFVKGYFENIK
jgi:hypothetical protein